MEKIISDLSEIKKHLGPEIICLQEGVPGIIPEDRDSIGLVAHFGRSFKWLFSREANGVITLSSTRPSDIPEPLLSRWKEGWIFTRITSYNVCYTKLLRFYFLYTDRLLSRKEGWALLGIYGGYVIWTILAG